MIQPCFQSTIFKYGCRIVKTLQQHGYSAYFVGGAVRDMILGKTPKDIDIVTSAMPEEVIGLFPESKLVGACFGVVNVSVEHHHFEVATFREERDYEDGRHPLTVRYTDDPVIDAQRRDFTINGLYYDPIAEKTFDFVGGLDDLKRGVIRAIGVPTERFAEDYLRMLRAVRFAVRFDFKLDAVTQDGIYVLAFQASRLSAERIREELDRMLTGPRPAQAIRMLKMLGLLNVLLPEVADLEGVTQPEKFHPEGDVFTHTMLMLEHMEYPDVELAWSVLLHDIAKPETLVYDEQGTEHFYGHEETGAKKAVQILNRLAFSNKRIEHISHAIRNHMRYAHVSHMREAKVRRLIAEDTFPLELELHRIDCISCHGKMQNFYYLLDKVNQLKQEIKLPEPLLTGADLIEMGYSPGPVFGRILRDVMNALLEGCIHNREDAVLFVQHRYQIQN